MIRLPSDPVFYYKISPLGLEKTNERSERASFNEIFSFLKNEKSLNIKQVSQFVADWSKIKDRLEGDDNDSVCQEVVNKFNLARKIVSYLPSLSPLNIKRQLDDQVKLLNDKLNRIKQSDLIRLMDGLELEIVPNVDNKFLHRLWLWYHESTRLDHVSRIEKKDIVCKKIIECKYNSAKTNLILDDLQLRSIPACIGEISHLQILTLSANNLSKLPLTLSRLRRLRRIDLSGNEFREVPDCVTSLSNLIQLDLQFNQISFLSESFTNLEKLQILNLSGNTLEELLPEIGELKSLKYLNLSDNLLKFLPETLGNCDELQYLLIDSNPYLKELPLYLSHLMKLTFVKHYSVSNQLKFYMVAIKVGSQPRGQKQCSQFFCILLTKWIKVAGRRQNRVSDQLIALLKAHLWKEEIHVLNQWLVCLEKNPYFRGYQVNLAKLTCEMLQDLLEHSLFKKKLFKCIKKTNLDCQEDVARGYYEIYRSYTMHVNSRSRYEYPDMMEHLDDQLGLNLIRLKSARNVAEFI